MLLATTGMRRGEALGLRWADLDLETGTASVQQTVITVEHEPVIGSPKTAKNRRHRAARPGHHRHVAGASQTQAAERLVMGAGFTDRGLVFCRVDGGILHPERYSRSFNSRSRQLGLSRIRLHDLRHGWATMALAAGVHPKVVQERLGHANIGITLTPTPTSRRDCTATQQRRSPTWYSRQRLHRERNMH